MGLAKALIFFAEGYEEVEALTVVDLLRRAGIDIDMVSVTKEQMVTGSHKITVQTDVLYEDACFDKADILILPGGMPGTNNLLAHEGLKEKLLEFAADNTKKVAAICAAPSVLGAHGILQGKEATCYPGFEEKLTGAVPKEDVVVVDGNVITSRGMGTAIAFAAAIIEAYCGKGKADEILQGIIYK